MTEYRGGERGAHYSSDEALHCPACGTGLLVGEACSIPGCTREGQRASGRTSVTRPAPAHFLAPRFDAATQLDAQLFDSAHRRASAREHQDVLAEWREQIEQDNGDAELIELRRLTGPTVNRGPR